MAKSKPNEISIVRVYDAPVKAVWDAWVDPKQAAKWWGPRGFTITTHSKDFKVGGIWHYTMHGPDGVDYPNKTVYLEIEKHAKMIYDHGGYDDRPPLFRVTVLFSEKSGKTTMDMTMGFASEEIAKESVKFIKKAGGNGTWDRLAEYLDKESNGKDTFVMNRSFAAPVDVIFDMWTKPEHFSKWLPPTGFNMEFIKADVRAGGQSFYVMSNADMKMHGTLEYVEIQKPEKIVYIQRFTDENQNMTKPPFDPTWPDAMLTTVKLTAEEDGKTRVTLLWETHGKTTETELAAFLKERAGMSEGWSGSFDKLDDLIAKK